MRENMINHGMDGRIIETVSARGKELRAEPIVGLYEQGKIHHTINADTNTDLSDLEEQMCGWVPSDRTAKSPDRVDALVFALTEVMKDRKRTTIASPASLGRVG